ncbi:hypothetical protein OHA98_40855 [Streptomyces sp. NBC_00654]|uniref:hypothetical protein n=1 Tax=Streptomyces sp. NBC_00654 TaxID=2975799 RepID=UPI00224FDC59|nr:hypothetical protein [Streptomyces sp. NBC_00654]MCX4970971.1 hypothetical protein [Streptomyces sp. NBC_00654]
MVPIGQHMANLRRKGQKNGLGKDPERAAVRAAQLKERFVLARVFGNAVLPWMIAGCWSM